MKTDTQLPMKRFISLSLSLTMVLSMAFSARSWARERVLNELLIRASEIHSAEQTPVVVMDLDETVVDSTTRRFQSYREATAALCGENRSGDCAKAMGLNLSEFLALPNRYDQAPLFDRVGLNPSEWRKKLMDQAIQIYLSGKWMELDQAVPGATEYVQELRQARAKIFFVTSRWESRQGEGSFLSLKQLGMITDSDREFLLLRPDGMSSIDFKRRSFQRIQSWVSENHATVIGAFENEPENMNAMTDEFPRAQKVFVEGAWLRSEDLRGTVARIRDFR